MFMRLGFYMVEKCMYLMLVCSMLWSFWPMLGLPIGFCCILWVWDMSSVGDQKLRLNVLWLDMSVVVMWFVGDV